jgi:uncharacterized protein
MIGSEIVFTLAGETVVALAERALFWPREKTLFVADVHFGKDATFRHALRWVPPGTTAHDLERLRRLMEEHCVENLVILGDAFHSEHAGEDSTRQEIARWRERQRAPVLMVEGNHDRHATALARDLRFDVVKEPHELGPWTLRHHPGEGTHYVLCGHLHPVATVRGAARQSLRVPCFWAGEKQCVLPAFGGFTGGATVRPARVDRVFLVADGRLVDATPAVL